MGVHICNDMRKSAGAASVHSPAKPLHATPAARALLRRRGPGLRACRLDVVTFELDAATCERVKVRRAQQAVGQLVVVADIRVSCSHIRMTRGCAR